MRHFARLTAGAAFILLFAGGLVTSTGSGLAVPDWPLSFGTFFPRMIGGVRFEHGHRLIAGVVALMTFALAAWVLRRERRPLLRVLAAAAAAGILLQALLGGLTVLLKLPAAVSMSHAILGQTVFCLLLCLADALPPGRSDAQTLRRSDAQTPFLPGILAVAALYVQLFLGALVRHTGAGVAVHALWALGVTILVGSLVARTFRSALADAGLSGPAILLAVLLPLQLALGLATWALRGALPWHSGFDSGAFTATLHLAAGAATLGACWVWTLRAYKTADA